MLKRKKLIPSEKVTKEFDKIPDEFIIGSDKKKKSLTKDKKIKKPKKEALFIRVLNRLLKLDCLKLLELSIGFVKGFAVKIEFFEKKNSGDKNA